MGEERGTVLPVSKLKRGGDVPISHLVYTVQYMWGLIKVIRTGLTISVHDLVAKY